MDQGDRSRGDALKQGGRMGNDDKTHRALPRDRHDFVPNLRLGDGVEHGGHFVADEIPGPREQRTQEYLSGRFS